MSFGLRIICVQILSVYSRIDNAEPWTKLAALLAVRIYGVAKRERLRYEGPRDEETAEGHGGSGPRRTGPSQAHTDPTPTHPKIGCTSRH